MIVKDDEIIKVETQCDTEILEVVVPILGELQATTLVDNTALLFDPPPIAKIYRLSYTEDLLEGVKLRHYKPEGVVKQ